VQLPGPTHLVICCRGSAEEALSGMRDIMQKLRLTVNETKTRVCRLPEEKFDFLGLYVWTLLLAANWAGLSGHCSSEEAGDSHV